MSEIGPNEEFNFLSRPPVVMPNVETLDINEVIEKLRAVRVEAFRDGGEPWFNCADVLADLTRRLAEVTAERDEAEKEARGADDAGRSATGALMDQIARAEAAEAALSRRDEALRVAREALEPFARLADVLELMSGTRPRTGSVFVVRDHRVDGPREMTVEHCLTARSAIAEIDALIPQPQEAANAGENG
jgi:hypothetical protein